MSCANQGSKLQAEWCQDARARPGGKWVVLAGGLLGTQGKPGLEVQVHQAWRWWRNHHALFGPALLLGW